SFAPNFTTLGSLHSDESTGGRVKQLFTPLRFSSPEVISRVENNQCQPTNSFASNFTSLLTFHSDESTGGRVKQLFPPLHFSCSKIRLPIENTPCLTFLSRVSKQNLVLIYIGVTLHCPRILQNRVYRPVA